MKTKYVIGPWEVRNRLDVFNTRGIFIATAFTHDERFVDSPQHQLKASYLGAAEANAALIAAAPDLAGALRMLVADIDSCETEEDFVLLATGGAIEQARAALERVGKGRGDDEGD